MTVRREKIIDDIESELEGLVKKIENTRKGEEKLYMEIDKDLLDNVVIIVKDVFQRME